MDEDREIIERRIAAAKRSMSTRLSELGERLDKTRRTLSLREKVDQHPLIVLGAAAAVGLLLGRRGGSRAAAIQLSRARPPRGLVSSATHEIVRSLVTTIAAAVVSRLVKQMIHDQDADHPGPLADPEHRTTGVRVYPVS